MDFSLSDVYVTVLDDLCLDVSALRKKVSHISSESHIRDTVAFLVGDSHEF